jgi:cell division protein FtsI (penicillin-binding protein 3)
VHTGQILALAIRPTFNPNDFRHATPELLRDHAVSDVYEPGSTFKLVTYSAAIDQGVVTPDDIIDCQGGSITLAGRVIHDDKSDHFGRIPVHEALEHSSDVAAVKLALKVGPNHFYDYIRNFGFGSRTGLELPGETRGLLNPPRKWGSSSIGSIAIGQEVAVTPLQLVSMVSTLANGGVYLPPHIVMAQPAAKPGEPVSVPVAHPFKAGGELPNPLPEGAHRVISTMSAAQMRKMMEGVVLYGTGKQAQLNGYSSGGKTGTAQKIDPATHTYSKTMHVASFAGIAPVNSPVIAVAVVLDNPKGDYYGGAASAPVFAQVAQQTLEYLGVPHDVEVRAVHPGTKPERDLEPVQEHTGDENALMAAVNELPSDDPLRQAVTGSLLATEVVVSVKAGAQSASPLKAPPAQPDSSQETTSVAVGHSKLVRVPSLIGLPVRKVAEQAAMAGLNLQVEGRGLVRSQMPAAGSQVQAGSAVLVHCTR